MCKAFDKKTCVKDKCKLYISQATERGVVEPACIVTILSNLLGHSLPAYQEGDTVYVPLIAKELPCTANDDKPT